MKVTGVFDNKIQEQFLKDIQLLINTPLSQKYPDNCIMTNNSNLTIWYNNNWLYILRPKNKIICDNIIKCCDKKISNLLFILYLYGISDVFLLSKSKNDLDKILNNFEFIDNFNYISQPNFLKKGDILISNTDIAISMIDGNKVNQIAPTTVLVKEQKVRVISDKKINVRYRPIITSGIKTQIQPNTICTIIEEKEGWGKLKSGKGWINLSFTEKL